MVQIKITIYNFWTSLMMNISIVTPVEEPAGYALCLFKLYFNILEEALMLSLYLTPSISHMAKISTSCLVRMSSGVCQTHHLTSNMLKYYWLWFGVHFLSEIHCFSFKFNVSLAFFVYSWISVMETSNYFLTRKHPTSHVNQLQNNTWREKFASLFSPAA